MVDQGREFYNKLMQESLENSNILMYSTHNEGKSVTIKTQKAEIYKKWQIMIAIILSSLSEQISRSIKECLSFY